MKKFALFLLVCIIPLATGCPVSTPKQPATFNKLNDRQDDILIKFDNELANYDCLTAGRTWTETSTAPADQQTQQQLAQVRDRQRQINQRLAALETDATANQNAAQAQEEDFYAAQDELEKNILIANIEQQDIAIQSAALRQDLLNLKQALRKTPVKQTARRTELQSQINITLQNINANDSRIVPNQKDIARMSLELNQLQSRQVRERTKFQTKDAAIQAEQVNLNAELVTNRQREQALITAIQQQQPQPQPKKKKSSKYSLTSNVQPSYGTCSAGENTTPTADQKAQARKVRDTVIYQLIRFTDIQYLQFENDLYVKRASGSFLADALDLGGNLAATITNGERAKTIINASLIAFRGGRKSASIHYFQEQTADVLISSMQSARNRVLAEMVTQLQEKTVDQYPLDAALGDVVKYFYAGTLPRALQELKRNSSLVAIQTEDKVRVLKGVEPSIPATKTEETIAVSAFETLQKLSADSGSPTESVKTDALAKLQKIVEQIKADQTIIDELNADPNLKALFDKIQNADTKDGANLAQDLADIRYSATKTTTQKIDAIIVKAVTK